MNIHNSTDNLLTTCTKKTSNNPQTTRHNRKCTNQNTNIWICKIISEELNLNLCDRINEISYFFRKSCWLVNPNRRRQMSLQMQKTEIDVGKIVEYLTQYFRVFLLFLVIGNEKRTNENENKLNYFLVHFRFRFKFTHLDGFSNKQEPDPYQTIDSVLPTTHFFTPII